MAAEGRGMNARKGVRIEAQPYDGRRCRFTVSEPLATGAWAYFGGEASAKGSALAERLFGLEGVEAVLVWHDKVTITRRESGSLPLVGPAMNRLRRALGDHRAGASEWPRLGKEVGRVIRAHLESGARAISEQSIASRPSSAALRARVEATLDADVNPVLEGHGGGVEVVDLIDNVLYLKMKGGCQGCGLADVTLSRGVAAALWDAVPELGEIVDLTDHAGGKSPFFGRKASGARSPFARG